jgi:L-ascorbate metabolism protein UlaG (beta-lactamase superfamily)
MAVTFKGELRSGRILSRGAARGVGRLVRELLADADAALQPVGGFEHLEAQVAVERVVAREEVAHDKGGARVALPADEGREPAVDEEDFARALERRQFRERGLKVGERWR